MSLLSVPAVGWPTLNQRHASVTTRKRIPHRHLTGLLVPLGINTAPLRALFDNLQGVAGLESMLSRLGVVAEVRVGSTAVERAALALDKSIREVKKADWRGNRFKEREVRNAVHSVLGDDGALIDTVFEIVRNQRAY